MKQYFLALGALALCFVACKKDENIITGIPTSYIQSLVYTTGDSLSVEYNIDKTVYRLFNNQASGNKISVTPFYDTEGKINKVDLAYGTNLETSYTLQTLVYNSVAKVIKVSLFSERGAAYYDSISYKNGVIDTLYSIQNQGITMKYAYTWDANGNVSKVEQTYLEDPANVHTRTTTYTYDDKINPYTKVKGYYFINFQEGDFAMAMSANNILTATSSDAFWGYTGSNENSYTYDNNGYPVTINLKSTDLYTGQDPRIEISSCRVHYGK
jgi:hypothetical protein